MAMMENRYENLRAKMRETGVDALYVNSPENHLYVSGFDNPDGWLLVTQEKVYVFADFRYTEAAKEDSRKYTACDLLIIDDLGTELSGQFVTAALYSLINDRLLANKATIISTNLGNDAMQSRYSAPILSRLRGNFRRVIFLGEDIRVSKNKGTLR